MRAFLSSVVMVALAGAVGCGDDDRPPARDAGMDAGSADGGGAHCGNGVRDGDETHLDCGGSCGPCTEGQGCARPADCVSMVCVGGFCLMAACDDGILNATETDVDCGGGACPGCDAGGACTADADCVSGLCDPATSTCAGTSCTDGTMNSDETDVDCGGSCPGCAGGLSCAVDGDCASTICLSGTCTGSTCDDRVRNGDETDEDCGGGTCPACRDGSACLAGTDCESGSCVTDVCISCMDGRQNGDETDADCGGAVCPGCPDAGACLLAADCESGVCTGDVCQVPACDDTVQNGDETDVDCGGGTCSPCADGDMCADGGDCASGVCTSGACAAPLCDDGVHNGDETDVDCGGPTCGPRCADFRRCSVPGDCTTGACTMGFCGTTGCIPFTGTSTDTFGNVGCSVPLTPATLPCPDIRSTGTASSIGDDDWVHVPIGFSFDFYGTARTMATVQSNGGISFDDMELDFDNMCLPATGTFGIPEAFIATFWDDLDPSTTGSEVYYQTIGTAPSRQFVVLWDTHHYDMATDRIDVRAVLHEGTNQIDVCYVDPRVGDPLLDDGASATVGIQGPTSAGAVRSLQYSCDMATVTAGLLVRYLHP